MKFFRRLLRILLSIFVLFNVLLAFHAYRFTYFYDNPEKIKPKRPEQLSTGEKLQNGLFGIKFLKRPIDTLPGRDFEVIKLRTAEGFDLEGWYIPADSAKGTVLLFHGHSSNKGKILAETDYFHQLGYNTFSIDFRAHGNSGGNICTIGSLEAEDVKLAYDFVQQRGEQNLILWGVSMGAATVLKAVPEYHLSPTKIIVECPFASMYDAVKGRLRTLHVPESPFSELLLFWGSIERGMWGFGHAPSEYAKGISCPTLLNWGANDPRVQAHETEAIYDNLGTTNKRLVVFESAAHESFCRKEPAKWKERVKWFLEKQW